MQHFRASELRVSTANNSPLLTASSKTNFATHLPLWSFIALFAVFAFYLRGPYLGDIAPDYDEQLYQLIGQRLLRGDVPFVDIWDRKPVGLFIIYAAANLLGGGVWPYQLLALGCTVLAATQVFRLSRLVADELGATAAALLYIIFLSAFGAYVGQSEVFFIPLLLFMLSQAVRVVQASNIEEVTRRSIRLVIAGGLCLQVKYTVLPQCAFFGVLCLSQLWRLRVPGKTLVLRALQFASIGIAPTVAVTIFYALIGQFQTFTFANFESIGLRGALSGGLKDLYRFEVLAMGTPLLIAAAFGILAMASRGQKLPPVYLVVMGWTASALTSAMMVGNIYIYYFAPVVPGLAIVAAPAFGCRRSGAVCASLAILSGFFFFNPQVHRRVSTLNRASIAEIVKLAAPYVRADHSCLYVFDGPTALYQATASCLPTRFVYPDHLNNAQEEHALGIDTTREVARILANRPGVIVTASRPVVPSYNVGTAALVNHAVARDYVPMGQFRYYPRTLIVNVRRDLAARGPTSRSAGS